MNHSQLEFCAALKAARERRGLKLTDIAAATKVCPSYFSALERSDLRVWPKGLFRRSFFRGYASAVGLPVAETLEEFMRLFPEDERAAAASAAAAGSSGEPNRLALDESWRGPKVPILTRVVVAAIDVLAITLPAVAIAWSQSLAFATVFATVAMTYFTLSTLLLAESPAVFCLHRWQRVTEALRVLLASVKSAGETTDDSDDGSWFSDARRIRPRDQAPGLRVRFKVTS